MIKTCVSVCTLDAFLISDLSGLGRFDMLTCPVALVRASLWQRESRVKLTHDVSMMRRSVGVFDLCFYPSAGGLKTNDAWKCGSF